MLCYFARRALSGLRKSSHPESRLRSEGAIKGTSVSDVSDLISKWKVTRGRKQRSIEKVMINGIMGAKHKITYSLLRYICILELKVTTSRRLSFKPR